jgi:cytochrome c oxidase assembly protein subunit 15
MSPADRAVRRWLIASAVAVALAVVVGGITRLTESGLSITEWKPVRGILPPLGADAWNSAYQAYLRIPEAQTVHRGITLEEFRSLYWWEWIHRLLARGVGLVLALPYFWFLLKRKLRPQHRLLLVSLPVLALVQGILGWYMVKSGLAVRTDVSPYRLAAHLAVALIIFVIAVWTALRLGITTTSQDRAIGRLSLAARAGAGLTVLTMLSGAFVAGLDAGRVYNTFPLMAGKLIPPGYQAFSPWWRNAFENPAAAQFHHRLLAVSLGVGLLLIALAAIRSNNGRLRRAGGLLGILVIAQITLGILTLLNAVPPVLGVLHQATAVAVLTAILVTAQRSSR